MSRKLPNFIDGFMRYMEGKGSPSIYTRWSAIFAISAATERKTWMRTAKPRPLYPSQYIVLVGPAGIGKSYATSTVHDLLNEIKGPDCVLHIAPTSVSKASLVDALSEADRRIIRPMEQPSVITFNSLIAIPDEFGVFLPGWDNEFMNFLTHLWDCRWYGETRRTRSLSLQIEHPQLNLLSATTPAYLNSFLPEGAWDFGFMSRLILIYSGEVLYNNLFDTEANDEQLWKDLIFDLSRIHKLYGEFHVTDTAKEALNEWHRGGGFPAPDHPKMMSYNTRRPTHLMKLCMIASLAQDDELIITEEHFVEALDWMTEFEAYLPDIFKAMNTGGAGEAIRECWYYCYNIYIKKKDPVPESLIYGFLQDRVPIHDIEKILDVMKRQKLLEEEYTKTGIKGFKPKVWAA